MRLKDERTSGRAFAGAQALFAGRRAAAGSCPPLLQPHAPFHVYPASEVMDEAHTNIHMVVLFLDRWTRTPDGHAPHVAKPYLNQHRWRCHSRTRHVCRRTPCRAAARCYKCTRRSQRTGTGKSTREGGGQQLRGSARDGSDLIRATWKGAVFYRIAAQGRAPSPPNPQQQMAHAPPRESSR